MGTGFSCLENSSEARILWRSAEIVRFEIPRNFLTLNFNLHFWLLTVRNNLSWRLIFRPFVGSLLTPLGPSYSWVFPTNEIEVAMIAIDETTILMKRSKRRSSSPFRSSLAATVVRPECDDDEGICQKFVLHVQSLCFAYLKNLLPSSSSWLRSTSLTTRKTILYMRRFLWKTDDLMEIYHREARAFHKLLEIFQNVSRNFSKVAQKQSTLAFRLESCSKVEKKDKTKQKNNLCWSHAEICKWYSKS